MPDTRVGAHQITYFFNVIFQLSLLEKKIFFVRITILVFIHYKVMIIQTTLYASKMATQAWHLRANGIRVNLAFHPKCLLVSFEVLMNSMRTVRPLSKFVLSHVIAVILQKFFVNKNTIFVYQTSSLPTWSFIFILFLKKLQHSYIQVENYLSRQITGACLHINASVYSRTHINSLKEYLWEGQFV